MVNPNDIRVGNWLRNSFGKYGTVEGINFDILLNTFSGSRWYSGSELYPIPLIKDHFSLCGFHLVESKYIHSKTNVKLLYKDISDITLIGLNNEVSKITYIHELQNMFYILTSFELNPNLIGI